MEEIHIGQLVKATVRERRIKDVEFARMIGRSKQNVYDMYKRNDMEVKLLLTCSKALQHNFLKTSTLPSASTTTRPSTVCSTH